MLSVSLLRLFPDTFQMPMGLRELEKPLTMEEKVTQTALKRQGKPEEIAAVTRVVLSADASAIAGGDLLADAGVTAAMGLALAPTAE